MQHFSRLMDGFRPHPVEPVAVSENGEALSMTSGTKYKRVKTEQGYAVRYIKNNQKCICLIAELMADVYMVVPPELQGKDIYLAYRDGNKDNLVLENLHWVEREKAPQTLFVDARSIVVTYPDGHEATYADIFEFARAFKIGVAKARTAISHGFIFTETIKIKFVNL